MEGNFSENSNRMGQIGSAKSVWDNGLYAKGEIEGVTVEFLVDSGSTATLLSKESFEKMGGENTMDLHQKSIVMQSVDGKKITVYGYADINISFDESQVCHTAIICDITPEGILGQDFIMKHIKTWDLDVPCLRTRQNTVIPLETGGETQAVCRVLIRDEMQIPPHSVGFVPVDIVNSKQLASTGYVEGIDTEVYSEKLVSVVPGIVDPHQQENGLAVMNKSEECITLYPGSAIATCNSSYETMEETHEVGMTLLDDSTERDTRPQSGECHEIPPHLQELFDKSSVHLDGEEKDLLAELLIKYQSVFSKSSDDIGLTDRVRHRIQTGSAPPIRQAPRRQPFGKRDTEKEEIQKMLDRGIVAPSKSPWSSPIVLIAKRDGTTRFCVDYRRLNDVTIKDAYPLPRVDECLDALSGSKWFSCMDLNSGFWQILVEPEDQSKTAFTTSHGLYQFKVMPFGLVNAPSTFQRLMEDVLRGLQWVESLLYMDDIITPGPTVKESLRRLENVFKRLMEANLKLKPSKCIFFQKSVKFLGHIVSEEGVSTCPDKIQAVVDWPIPTNAKQVRSFLGLASYYRKFVKGFADIARPLHKICEKKAKFAWNKDCNDAFQKLKDAMTSAPILAYPKCDGGRFILDTDASDLAVGAVLSQEQDGQEVVISYMSKSLNKHEQSYCVTRKELLAVVMALRNFHSYVYGQEILLRTDNAAVSWMRSLKTPTGQMARWIQEVGTYNLVVTHRPGRKHGNADALSRRPCQACRHQQKLHEESQDCDTDVQQLPVDEVQSVSATTRNQAHQQNKQALTNNQCLLDGWGVIEVAQAQLEDPKIQTVYVAKRDNAPRPEWNQVSSGSSALKTLWRQWDRLEMHAGMLYRKWIDGDQHNSTLQLVVPDSKKLQVLKLSHDIPSAGHLGVDKTLDKVRQSFYWPAISDDVRRYVKSCDSCTARKLSKKKNRAPLGQYLVGEPMERVSIDILGPLPISKAGNRYILVMADCFTKWTECVPVPNQEAKTIAEAFVNNFVCRFGVPLQLHSDQGKCFESKLFQEMCALLDIDKTRTTSMRPQANGTVERFNRTLASMLTMYCNDSQDNWDSYLPQVLMAYRSSSHASTKFSPNKMVFGRDIVLPLQAMIGRPPPETIDNVDGDTYVQTLRDKLVEAHTLGRIHLRKAAVYQKKHYDTKAKRKSFAQGQLVWLHDPSRKIGVCSKLRNHWKGPFVITRVLDDLICLVKQGVKQRAKAYHIDRLWPYEGRHIPTWITRESRKLNSQ